MIMTCLQAFTHGHQAKLLSSGRLLVQCALGQPLLADTCKKFFHVLEVYGVSVVDVIDVVAGGPPLLLMVKAKSKMLMAVALL